MADIGKRLLQIEKDISSIRIQGATNVALATLEGVKLAANSSDYSDVSSILSVGQRLSRARENEPLARNAVKFVSFYLKNHPYKNVGEAIVQACDSFESYIAHAKDSIVEYGTEALAKERVILTHCHSSTSTKTLKNVSKLKEIQGTNIKVVSTETRPRYQGRKTAKKLFEEGIDVTLIIDSACASFIVDDQYLPVGAVLVGCDELLSDGSFINKVGTYSIALAAKKGVDEFYVATTLLKLDPDNKFDITPIEQRDAGEVWDAAPKGLKIINPAFERVGGEYVTGYITEAGVLKASELADKARSVYKWLFE